MKRFRKVAVPQPDNQMLLVSYIIHQCIGNYRLKLFNEKVKAEQELRKLKSMRKMKKDIDNDTFF